MERFLFFHLHENDFKKDGNDAWYIRFSYFSYMKTFSNIFDKKVGDAFLLFINYENDFKNALNRNVPNRKQGSKIYVVKGEV